MLKYPARCRGSEQETQTLTNPLDINKLTAAETQRVALILPRILASTVRSGYQGESDMDDLDAGPLAPLVQWITALVAALPRYILSWVYAA